MSPEFRLRPSLSVRAKSRPGYENVGVAGVQTPAFVERASGRVRFRRGGPCRRSSETIPGHRADGKLVRPVRTGPVFRFLDDPPRPHMRYTACTRSIRWRSDAATAHAVAALEAAVASLSTCHV